MKNTSIYVHIPFCREKCSYCDFLSFSGQEERAEAYTSALLNEIDAKSRYIENRKIKTIYIGGGTPTSIEPVYIEKIMSKLWHDFNIEKDTEITIEANPGTLDRKKIASYVKSGVNRFSLGLQSTDDDVLKSIGRIHTYNDFEGSYNLLRNLNIKNINIDLMMGLPGQKLEGFKEGLKKILDLKPEHLSCYGLVLEEGTPLYKQALSGSFKLDEDLEREMYHMLIESLAKAGYIHYEISNFALPGFSSRHNMVYWNLDDYVGLGLGAHSFSDNCRFYNISDMKEYIEKANGFQSVIKETERIELKNLKEEFMFLGLRKIQGVNCQDYGDRFASSIWDDYGTEIEKLIKEELLEKTDGKIKLSLKGLDFANRVFGEFIKS
ncbi:radical SAM family heme chaperone HemW [Alkalibacter saccharofermentans]|uniref:Heme chaperone HemW n=1 Tax=Alkalibacter saccharofermentans DSM 14828 TaxID=1120975 RepID=A0A1M4SNC5_9FIRM|nr:radical SAM family heme chaperone HemW [Alkalibacter saccharofermentans]SHE33662.1 oxygen-independent coproporphyrinogen-3 oxidase [Alkalibacter saccharofermentans DSM 14828]